MARTALCVCLALLLMSAGVAAAGPEASDGLRAESAPVFSTDDPAPGDWGGTADMPNAGALLGRLVLAMGLILAVLVGGLWLLQRFGRRALHLKGGERPLRVVDRIALAPKRWVCLLSVGGRYLLLGVAEKEISLLTEVLSPDDPETPPGDGDFSSLLRERSSAPALGEKR